MKAAKLLALALAAAPLAVADIIVPPTPRAFSITDDCDVMAENTVRATLVSKTDTTAVFEVLENLAYNRPVRYGDPKLTNNARFEVSLTPVPGQPAAVAQKIAGMQPGEEATMIVRHLFLFAPAAGQDPNVRPVTRIALRKDAVAPTPAPMPGTGLTGIPAGSMHSESVSVTVINGVRTEVRTTTDQLPGQPPVTRKYVNGVEVDPTTNAPLTTPTPSTPAAPATPATPQQPAAPAAPAQLPATPLTPATPVAPAAPAQLPATPAAPVAPAPQPAAPAGSTANDESQTIIEN